MKTQLKVVRGDITQMSADAIVNSANNDLVLGGGVSGAISRLAGPSVQEECHKIGTIPLGTAAVTGGGNLTSKWILHAAVNPLGLWADAKSVRTALRAALVKAAELGVKRLAMPALGTGAGALPIAQCADILLDEVIRHCEGGQTSLEEVMFVVQDEKPHAIFEERYRIRVLGEAPPPEPPPDPAEDVPIRLPPPPKGFRKPKPIEPPRGPGSRKITGGDSLSGPSPAGGGRPPGQSRGRGRGRGRR
jgi:O-acetyl-ADP-ribose deacetylase (regulator of RNase III)